jgi:hypothetical protein
MTTLQLGKIPMSGKNRVKLTQFWGHGVELPPDLLCCELPEQWLIASVVLRALWDLSECRFVARYSKERNMMLQAKPWIFDDENQDEIFSLSWCAEMLSDDPKTFISAIRDVAHKQLTAQILDPKARPRQ